MRVTVFGLGEAGSLIAADLARAGAEVHAYDPADVDTPRGVARHADPVQSVSGSCLVMAITGAVDAATALAQAIDDIDSDAVYADLATSTPVAKADLSRSATSHGLLFVDVALMGTVPGSGLATPALAAGGGAERYASAVNPLGAAVEVVGDRAGEAAARKLLRSVVTKGLTSLLIESLTAGEAHGSAEWLWAHLVGSLTALDEDMIRRLVEGTPKHIDRRVVEMESTRAWLDSLGVPSTMTSATAETLRRLRDNEGTAGIDPGRRHRDR